MNWQTIKDCVENRTKPIIATGTVIAMFVGFIVWWNASGLPRFAYASEVYHLAQEQAQTQLDFYIRSKRSDERVLFDLDQQIEEIRKQGKEIPDATLHQRFRIQEDLDHAKKRLDDAKRRN